MLVKLTPGYGNERFLNRLRKKESFLSLENLPRRKIGKFNWNTYA
jgi:hypothetical protein